MNLTSLITLPARLGYETARRTLDLAAAAGRMTGLFGGSEKPAGAADSGDRAEREAPRRPTRPKRGMDDVTLTRKVETEIFRMRGVAKGKIAVNAADGVIWLRGEAKTPELVKRIEARAAAVPEVVRVENLLHLPKTPAPSRTDTPPSQRKTRGRSERTAARETKARAERAQAARAQAEAPASAAAAAPATDDGDATLARRVESEIFRDDAVEKGPILVNAAAGTIWLRGTARDADQIHELQRRALSVPGVKNVENLLHQPGEPAPMAGEPAVPPEEREVTRRFSAERPGDGEPLPTEVAERGESRQRAPLGAGDDAPGGGGGAKTLP
jgi:osmotically-inducible protein OsmY